MHKLTSMTQIRQLHSGHWFDESSRRFFNSRISATAYPAADGSAFFVSSERMDYQSPRLYTVRRAFWDNGRVEIQAFGGFQEYASRSGADRAAKRYAGQQQA